MLVFNGAAAWSPVPTVADRTGRSPLYRDMLLLTPFSACCGTGGGADVAFGAAAFLTDRYRVNFGGEATVAWVSVSVSMLGVACR